MGAWSGQPFGNDAAADWAFELESQSDWSLVEQTLTEAIDDDGTEIDSDAASDAIAAAEVVAHGLGRPTQDDGYTEPVTAFVNRAGRPPTELVDLAVTALVAATSQRSELADLWEGDPEWTAANDAIAEALQIGS